MDSQISKIGSIVINLLRPHATITCIESLKKVTPDIKIYVGHQDEDNALLKTYCETNNINYIKLPFDCGIGVSRNILVSRIIEDGCQYIMWGDNDFIYDERFRIQNALRILDKDDKVGIVGGALIKNKEVQHYERLIYYNKEYKTACFIPLEYTYPEPHYIGKLDYYYCDMTFNFCVARKEVFTDEVKWDEDIKVKFEHSFYFIKFLEYSKLKVAYCPAMMVIHDHINSSDYSKYRYRVTDGVIYADKLGLKTGFAINETSWNHTLQKAMNFSELSKESPTYMSALKYAKNYNEVEDE